MMIRRVGLLAVAMVLVAAQTARALSVLTTAPISSTFADSDTLFCQAVNVSNAPIDVTFETRSALGALVSTLGPVTIQAGAVSGLQELGTAQYCKFFGAGLRRKIRAMAVYYDSVGQHYLLSVPAQ